MKMFFVTLVALAISAGAMALAQTDDSYPKSAPLRGSYFAYSGSFGDEIRQPTKREMKVSVDIRGRLARDMYNRLPKHRGASCFTEGMVEEHGNGDLWCTRTLKTGEIACAFTIDVRKGKSRSSEGC